MQIQSLLGSLEIILKTFSMNIGGISYGEKKLRVIYDFKGYQTKIYF